MKQIDYSYYVFGVEHKGSILLSDAAASLVVKLGRLIAADVPLSTKGHTRAMKELSATKVAKFFNISGGYAGFCLTDRIGNAIYSALSGDDLYTRAGLWRNHNGLLVDHQYLRF